MCIIVWRWILPLSAQASARELLESAGFNGLYDPDRVDESEVRRRLDFLGAVVQLAKADHWYSRLPRSVTCLEDVRRFKNLVRRKRVHESWVSTWKAMMCHFPVVEACVRSPVVDGTPPIDVLDLFPYVCISRCYLGVFHEDALIGVQGRATCVVVHGHGPCVVVQPCRLYCTLPRSANAFWIVGSAPPKGVPDVIASHHVSRWRTFYVDIGILQADDKLPAGCLGGSLSMLLGREQAESTDKPTGRESIMKGKYTLRQPRKAVPLMWGAAIVRRLELMTCPR